MLEKTSLYLCLTNYFSNAYWVLYAYHSPANVVYLFNSVPSKNDEDFNINRADGKTLMERHQSSPIRKIVATTCVGTCSSWLKEKAWTSMSKIFIREISHWPKNRSM